MERAGNRCEFWDCTLPVTTVNPLEMAHLLGVQSGGSRYRDVLENVAIFCKHHHDWLDGRLGSGVRYENEMASRGFLDRRWKERR
jgi:hypothetical protein